MSELKTNLQSILQEKTTKIIPQNIKKDVEVLGVTGSYDKEDIHELEAELADAQNELATVRRDLDNSTATISGNGENVTLNGTAEARFKKPPLPMGNSEQVQYSGKQLLNLDDATYSQKGVTVVIKNGVVTLNGTATEAVAFDINENFNTETGYKLNGCYGGSSTTYKLDFWTSSTTYPCYNGEETILPDNTTGKIRIVVYSGTTVNNIKIYPMISTTGGDYEPYVGGTASPNPDYPQEITNVTGDVEVVVENKNLFNKETVEDGKYINNAGEIREYHTYTLSDYISVKPSTKYSYQGISAFSERLAFYDKNKNLISVDIVSTLLQYQTITTPSNCYYFRTTVLKVDIDKYQFEENSTSTNFVEHKEQVFTFPLGNEKLMLGDYLADDGIHHVRGQVVLDGSESWYIGTYAPANSVQFLTQKPNNFFIETGTEGLAKIKSSHFINQDTVNGMRIGYNIAFFPSNSYNITTVEDFKTWLSTHNITVEYELEQEVIVPYTSAQQEVYNQIKQAISYEEQTNVSSNTIALFDIIALRNMNTILNTLENDVDLLE